DEDAIVAAVERGIARCDAVVTSGGVSVGDFDHVTAAIRHIATGPVEWLQVAVRPAKPLAFGVVEGVPVFGLPGNPVPVLVPCHRVVRSDGSLGRYLGGVEVKAALLALEGNR
ncbi:MAG TPA: methylated-DNA--[protein]-cysteine S-methyltransferase, partial [Acidimicrobiales bacterium]|nr:methylated-DNA--[protein]-cysteine S-methyltransferase [Acidimicrobiales bacterium]